MLAATEQGVCATAHGLNTISGYVVRRTFFDSRESVDEFTYNGAASYGSALEHAKSIRLEPDHVGFALVDPLYVCGCRGRG